MTTTILLYLLCGLFAGFTAGLFGVGGGMIIVPALLWMFHTQGFDPVYATHLAIGTSLAVIMITSISSIKAHHNRQAVRWDIMRQLVIGLLLGALFGAWIAKRLPSNWLQLIIGLFALYTAISMYQKTRPKTQSTTTTENMPSQAMQISAGGLIGIASAIFGIGGGTLTVPYLSHYGVSMRQAVGTAAAGGLPIAIAGALGFMLFGSAVHDLPPYAIGFVYLPAFVGISITSVFAAQLGARAAHFLPSNILKQLFIIFLFFVGCLFIYKAYCGFVG